MEIYKKAENDQAILTIYHDDTASDPREEFDNLGHMICWHSRYCLGDKHNYNEPRTFLEILAFQYEESDNEVDYYEKSNDELLDIIQENAVILPLFLYAHSGITMNTGGFSCPWDSGQVGYIYVTKEEVVEEYGDFSKENQTKAKKVLEAEVKTYDQYLTGDVYGFVLEQKKDCGSCGHIEKEQVDSCWGFYGDEFLESELKEHISEEYVALIEGLDFVS